MGTLRVGAVDSGARREWRWDEAGAGSPPRVGPQGGGPADRPPGTR